MRSPSGETSTLIHVPSVAVISKTEWGARSASMGFNRIVDARIDKLNPRTADREIPAGTISAGSAIFFVICFSLVFIFAAGMIGAHKLLGPRRDFDEKLDPFECGEKQIVSPHQRFSVKFYLVAMLFIIFDI